MVRLAGYQKTVNKTERGARLFQGGYQHALVEVACHYMMPVPGMGALPCHIIYTVVDMGNGCRVFSLAFCFKIYLVPNGYGVGAAYVIGFKDAAYPGFTGFAVLAGNGVPVAG